MRSADHFKVVDLPSLIWPSNVTIPSKRFRLFVAADTENNTVDVVSASANAALEKGMVYFCSFPGVRADPSASTFTSST